MAVRLWILGFFVVTLAALWFWSLRSTPRKGLLRWVERLFLGIILCFLMSRICLPLGISVPTGPAASALTGVLGLPGTLLAFFAVYGLPGRLPLWFPSLYAYLPAAMRHAVICGIAGVIFAVPYLLLAKLFMPEALSLRRRR